MEVSIEYSAARLVALALLGLEKDGTNQNSAAVLESILDQTLEMPRFKHLDREILRRMLEADVNIYVTAPRILEDNTNHIPWLEERRSEIDWSFWNRYRQYLVRKWPNPVVESIDATTDEILGRLENPTSEDRRFYRRGMVVGQVQSGKTANYTGLICKAVDAGYKIIIVLAGNHNSLRSQTQMRLDEEFLGFDTTQFRMGISRIGVGLLPGSGTLEVVSLTSRDENGDLSRSTASRASVQLSGAPILLVVKKNGTVLRTVHDYFTQSPLASEDTRSKKRVIDGYPLLMIDDEADLASINTADIPTDENGELISDYDPTKINGCIREILSSFGMKSYVGYTATPFANIFIHPDTVHKDLGPDLFPESFILNLSPPSDYIGPVEVFGLKDDQTPPLPVIRYVDDYEAFMPNKHKKDFRPRAIPDSLRTALESFILSCAIRRARGDKLSHNSMLIHVTRFTDVQAAVHELIEEELSSMKNRIKYGDGKARPTFIDELKTLFETDYVPVSDALGTNPSDLSWDKIEPEIRPAASKIRIRRINGTTQDILDYRDNAEQGLSLIVIGGDKLSRGLTLEGLTVSYFLRATKLYDTLMQMGRWFGYKPGYYDLCRIYLTRELSEWFQHITLASEELRREFEYMHSKGMTPRDYGLRVRSHPVLMVTSRVKMRTSEEIEVSYSMILTQTRIFDTSRSTAEKNFHCTDEFLHTLGEAKLDESGSWYLWKDVAGEAVAHFLNRFSTPEDSDRVNGKYLSEYIEKQLSRNELSNWTIGLRTLQVDDSKDDSPDGASAVMQMVKIGPCNVATLHRSPRGYEKPKLDMGAMVSAGDEALDLTDDERSEAIRRAAGPDDSLSEREAELVGEYIREVRSSSNGLLLLYPIDPVFLSARIRKPEARTKEMVKADPDFELKFPLIGFAISFPRSPTAEPISYRINTVYSEQEKDVT